MSALNSLGQISMGGTTVGESIALELGLAATSPISLGTPAVYILGGKSSASSVDMGSFRGRTAPTPYGTLLSQYCSGSTLVQVYADGSYGTYTVNTPNSPLCAMAVITGTVGINSTNSITGVSMTSPQFSDPLGVTSTPVGPITNIPAMSLTNGVTAYMYHILWVNLKTPYLQIGLNVSSAITQANPGWSTCTIVSNGSTNVYTPAGAYQFSATNSGSSQYAGPAGQNFAYFNYKVNPFSLVGASTTITFQ